jgi:HAD superfamily hydrolase (TIGR01490 family)
MAEVTSRERVHCRAAVHAARLAVAGNARRGGDHRVHAVASSPVRAVAMTLALFDLDHTLLSGDSDLLWCHFLVERGMLPKRYRERATGIAGRYTAGTVSPPEYCGFYAGLTAGWTCHEIDPLRARFFDELVRPRIPDDTRALLQTHRASGDTLLLTTATNRVVSELTARELGVDHYLCTEVEAVDGRFTGRVEGAPNMGTGKLVRLRAWLADHSGSDADLRHAVFYSDSINDLALLSAVGRPVVVDPDPRLEATALRKRWTLMRMRRSA